MSVSCALHVAIEHNPISHDGRFLWVRVGGGGMSCLQFSITYWKLLFSDQLCIDLLQLLTLVKAAIAPTKFLVKLSSLDDKNASTLKDWKFDQ